MGVLLVGDIKGNMSRYRERLNLMETDGPYPLCRPHVPCLNMTFSRIGPSCMSDLTLPRWVYKQGHLYSGAWLVGLSLFIESVPRIQSMYTLGDTQQELYAIDFQN